MQDPWEVPEDEVRPHFYTIRAMVGLPIAIPLALACRIPGGALLFGGAFDRVHRWIESGRFRPSKGGHHDPH